MQGKPRVVVTGLGVVSPLGLDENALWDTMLSGRTGIRRVTSFDVTDYKAQNGAEVDSESLATALRARGIKPFDRTVDMGLLAAAQALEQAGVQTTSPVTEPTDMATIFGTGVGSSHSLYTAYAAFFDKGLRGIRPTSVPRCMANAVASNISVRYQLTGPNYVIVSACTSSTAAIGNSFRMIQDGHADRVLCGGADASFDPITYGGWNNMGVMSAHSVPEQACRPFDADRNGCVLGEGAAALVLESLDSATRNGRRIRAELIGFGESSDALHMTRPNPAGQARAMTAALRSAGIGPTDVGFINAHGTATKANDEAESASIAAVLGAATPSVPVASNKSFFGHLLGAAGAMETIVTILGLEQKLVPANLNLDHPDPACDCCLVGREPTPITSPIAMKNNFGFGGNNAVLVIRRWDP